MYIDNYNKYLSRNVKKSTKFYKSFMYWKETLFEYCMKLFTWDGLPETIPQKEIEIRLLCFGKCVIVKTSEKKLISATVELTGNTDYFDEFTHYNYSTGLHTGEGRVNIDGVLINNNALRNPLIDKIDRYSVLLAHTEVSFINALVNARSMQTYKAIDNSYAEAINTYRQKLFEGEQSAIVDEGMIGIEVTDNASHLQVTPQQLFEVRNDLLTAFLEEIGVRKSVKKKERLIIDEVGADEIMLKLNIKDMLDNRIKACENIKKVFDIDVSCVCNVDYDSDGKIGREENEENENS